MSISLHAASVRRGNKWALRDVSWNISPGERWALLGDNGAGKTQLLKLLSGDVWPTPTGRARAVRAHDQHGVRKYRLAGRDLELSDAKARVAYVGSEQQDKYARYGWNPSVRDLIATGLQRSDLLLRPVTLRQRRKVAAALRACGMLRHAQREYSSLSYGQKRVALLARALVQQPDWLLLDELYNGLDIEYRRRIDALLSAARRRGQSWIATAHRALDIPRGTGRVIELESGRVRRIAPLRARSRESLSTRAQERRGAARRTTSVGSAQSARAVRSLKLGHERAGRRRGRGAVLVELAHADLFVDYRAILRKVDWQLRKGDHWAVYGANGAGKSSFLKLLYGDLSPALGGRITRRGVATGVPIVEWKRRIGFVSAELQSDYAVNVSVRDLVASGRYASIGLVDEPTASDRRAAARWLKFFALSSAAMRLPRELSYGEMRRALIARAMAADPRLLLLDEPLTGLDPTQRALLKRLLRRLMPKVTLVIAVHHPEDLPAGMTHALHLHNRRAYSADLRSAT